MHRFWVHAVLSSQLSAAPPWHVPPAQVSFVVQTSPSLQAPVVAVWWQPSAAMQVSMVHGRPSAQFCCAPDRHDPPWQPSPTVHALLSVQVAELAKCAQPKAPSQASSVHGLPSAQFAAPPGTHAPPEHVSPTVHALPSVHPAVVGTFLHPSAASHESVVHALLSAQSFGLPPVQIAFQHVSPAVHALPSSQPPLCARWVQPIWPLQPSNVHGLPSSQPIAVPLAHDPARHVSAVVHTLPSEHVTPSWFSWAQPPVVSQESTVQPLPSSQPSAAPP